ncbi:Hsp70 family protein [Pseudonocardia hispaniensis]|uniref:Hsp70 family protein n=1 Tax=Pseudonocardia hispaniensis TaxID=904933 RepID=A0ABW1J0K7_9PSEU
MTYNLGVDLGTTFVAAAIAHESRVEMFTLGDRSVVTPAVVYLREDGTVVTGDAASRRAVSSPERVGREFKRRLGDPTPVMLGGIPYAVTALLGALLRDILTKVSETEGRPPGQIVLTHPANWGPFRRELFEEVPQAAGLTGPRLVTEPEAAAAHYAASRQLADGDVVAVYDLGGGTFDATVLRKRTDAIEILGIPEGIERLGGVDFDEAILSHVNYASGGALSELDLGDPQTAIALARLRQDCVLAKEALSIDTETTIPVFLPNRHFDVRLTRAEFEDMVRAPVESTIVALERTLRSANVTPEQLTAVLLVGGSSRIPLIATMLTEALRRPTVVDAHPKYAVALGAATLAGTLAGAGGPNTIVVPDEVETPTRVTAGATGPPGPAAAAAAGPPTPSGWAGSSNGSAVGREAVTGAAATVAAAPRTPTPDPRPEASGSVPPGAIPEQQVPRSAATAGRTSPAGPPPRPPGPWPEPSGPPPPAGGPPGDTRLGAPPPARPGRTGRTPVIVAAVVALLALVGVLGYVAVNRLGGSPGAGPAEPTGPVQAGPAPPGTVTVATSVPIPTIGPTIPVGTTPGFVAASPNGKLLYIANRNAGVVTVVDTAVNAVTATIPITTGPPQYLTFSADGKRVYVSVFNDARTVNVVAVLDTTTNSVIATIPVGTRPFALAVQPNGDRLYVPNHDSGNVSVIDTGNNTLQDTITVARNPHWVAFSPDGTRAYTANHESNLVSAIDTATNKVIAEVPVGTSPHSIAVHPNRPLVANVNYDSASVSVIDTNTLKVIATIPVGTNPQYIAWAPDGRFAYTANVTDGTVSVINAETFQVTATIPTGKSPTSIAVLPNGKQAYVSNLGDGTLRILDIGT